LTGVGVAISGAASVNSALRARGGRPGACTNIKIGTTIMKRSILLALCAALLTPALTFAQSAFIGTWKMDIKNNIQMPSKPYRYLLADGVYHCRSCAPAYSVKADGMDHKVTGHPYYDTVSVTIVDEHTVDLTHKKAGKTVISATFKVASDGLSETYESTDSSDSSGAPVKMKADLSRIGTAPSGAHAVSGSWRAVKFEDLSENGLLTTYALDGDTLKMTQPTGQSFSAPLDGKDSPFLGDPGQTSISMKRIDDRTIDETDRRDGKVIGTSHLTLSADGRTMSVAWHDLLQGSSGSYVNIKQ
jgi:hypothetical protein